MLFKRVVDIPLALLAIIVLSPLFLVLGLIIRFTSMGPVVFSQKRVGRFGKEFGCLKFRTMHPDAEKILRGDPALYEEYVRNDFKLPPEKDPRVTPIGKFLRKTSLDELPQFFNVLKGDMSFIGPRPIVPDELVHYSLFKEEFLTALPGITGKWQVGGRSALHYPERAQLELGYVREWTFMEDIRILLKTFVVVLKRDGAF